MTVHLCSQNVQNKCNSKLFPNIPCRSLLELLLQGLEICNTLPQLFLQLLLRLWRHFLGRHHRGRRNALLKKILHLILVCAPQPLLGLDGRYLSLDQGLLDAVHLAGDLTSSASVLTLSGSCGSGSFRSFPISVRTHFFHFQMIRINLKQR